MIVRVSSLTVGVVLLGCLLLFVVAQPAAAQQAPANETEGCTDPEQVDPILELCAAELDSGEAVLTFQAEREYVVTLSDSAAFAEGGDVPTRTVTISANGTTTVRFDVGKTEAGKAGVGLQTDLGLYSVVLSEKRYLLGGPWTVQDARYAGGGGTAGAALSAAVTVLRRRRGDGGEPRQIA